MEQTIPVIPIVEVQVLVRIPEPDHKRVLSTGQDFNRVTGFLLEQYARGGVMIKAAQANYLSTISGMIVKTSEDVLQIVENGIKRHSASGNLTVSYSLDPAYAEPMEELARQQGRSVEEILQEACNVVFTNSWLYSIETTGGTLNFTREAREEMERIVGHKPVTGASLVEWLRENQKPALPRVSRLQLEVRERMEQQQKAKAQEVA